MRVETRKQIESIEEFRQRLSALPRFDPYYTVTLHNFYDRVRSSFGPTVAIEMCKRAIEGERS